jgi:hypothetical protein
LYVLVDLLGPSRSHHDVRLVEVDGMGDDGTKEEPQEPSVSAQLRRRAELHEWGLRTEDELAATQRLSKTPLTQTGNGEDLPDETAAEPNSGAAAQTDPFLDASHGESPDSRGVGVRVVMLAGLACLALLEALVFGLMWNDAREKLAPLQAEADMSQTLRDRVGVLEDDLRDTEDELVHARRDLQSTQGRLAQTRMESRSAKKELGRTKKELGNAYAREETVNQAASTATACIDDIIRNYNSASADQLPRAFANALNGDNCSALGYSFR